MVTNGLKCKNVQAKYLKARKEGKKRGITVPEPDDLNCSYVYSNSDLRKNTKTKDISNFCKLQHLKYPHAHVTHLDNNSFRKQLLFSCDRKGYSRDRWIKIEKEVGVSKMQVQKIMSNKTELCLFSILSLRRDALKCTNYRNGEH